MFHKKSIYSQPHVRLLPNFWDIIAFMFVVIILALFAWAGHAMQMPFHLGKAIPISLNPRSLPSYAVQTSVRMFIAMGFSILASLSIGTLAAKNKRAEKILIPLIDILQSVPILGYLSLTIAAFIELFPNSMIGPECAVIFAVFTSQVWNMILSVYQSLKTIPKELKEMTKVYQLSGWQNFWRLEAPYAVPGLLWNAMMSMSGGWFFIVAAESISVANQHINLPGIGSYIAEAILHRNTTAIGWAIFTMLLVILIYDQVIFRPLLSWSEKFSHGDNYKANTSSWLLLVFKRTRFLQIVFTIFGNIANKFINLRFGKTSRHITPRKPVLPSQTNNLLWYLFIGMLLVGFGYFLWNFIYKDVTIKEISYTFMLGGFTAIRVFILIALCSLVWVPVGVWIGMRPALARYIQPCIQFLAAFPANLFFPIFVITIVTLHLNVNIWTAPLMVLGTQWYILFNVIAGTMNIPTEMKLMARNMQLRGWTLWKRFLLPAIFPFYVTGAITAAGGAWNASIVAEIIHWGSHTLIASGLGSYIVINTTAGNFEKVLLGVVTMCILVSVINIMFWRRLYKMVESRYQFG